MSLHRLFNFFFGLPTAEQLIGMLILIIVLAALSAALYRVLLKKCIQDGIHPTTVSLTVTTLAIAIFVLVARLFTLLPVGGGWISVAGSLLAVLVGAQFLVKKIVPWVGGIIMLIVLMLFVIEYSGIVLR